VNFATITMTATRPVAAAPIPFIVALRHQ